MRLSQRKSEGGRGMSTLSELLDQYAQIGEIIRRHIYGEIDKIPENEKIHRIGQCCFTVEFSELQHWKVMDAEFYDFSCQKSRLKAILTTKDTLESQIKRLENAAKTRKLKVSTGCNSSYTMSLHPEMCEALIKILGGLNTEPSATQTI